MGVRAWCLLGAVMCLAVPVRGVEDVSVEIEELRIQRVPADPYGTESGTTVTIRVTLPANALAGVDFASSALKLTDSSGKDLTAAGKQANRGPGNGLFEYRYSSTSETADRLSVIEPTMDSEPEPRTVMLKLHTTAVPAKGSNSVRVKGKLVLRVKHQTLHAVKIPVSEFKAGNTVQLGDQTLEMTSGGRGGSASARPNTVASHVAAMAGAHKPSTTFTSLKCRTSAKIVSARVVGKEHVKGLVEYDRSFGGQFRVFSDNLEPTDKVAVVYSAPDKSVTISAADLNAGKPIRLGNKDLRINRLAKTSFGGKEWCEYEFLTTAKIDKVTVKTDMGSITMGPPGSTASKGGGVVYEAQALGPEDKMTIHYSFPESKTVDVDKEASFGFAAR